MLIYTGGTLTVIQANYKVVVNPNGPTETPHRIETAEIGMRKRSIFF